MTARPDDPRTSARGDGEPPFDDFVGRRAASFRRRLVIAAALAVAAVVGVSAALAFRQYSHAQHAARVDLKSRAVVAAAVIDTSFAGDVATLNAVAQSRAFVTGNQAQMRAYLSRIAGARGEPFNGGLGWVDRRGVARLSTTAPPGARPVSVADRVYFRRVVASGAPYVSAGLISRRQHQPVIVVAVPTRTADGRLSGVLAASIRLRTVSTNRTALELGYQGLEIVDRDGNMLLSRLEPVPNRGLLTRIRRTPTGVIAGAHGLRGGGDDVVAYATAALPGWLIVIDRPRSAVDAAAWHSLVLELGSLGAAALIVAGLVTLMIRRSRRDRELQEARARAWSELTRSLAAAATPDEVAEALVHGLATAFPDSLTFAAFETVEGSREVRTNPTQPWRRIAATPGALDELAEYAMARRGTLRVDRLVALAPALSSSGKRLRALHCIPLERPGGDRVGGLALVCQQDGPLEDGEWALLTSFAEEGARAIERSRRFEHEHDLAVQLQRSLLPDALPQTAGITLAGHYRAGGAGLQVGGDWYDAVRRPDGILHLSVGDVIGRGVGAATLMGRYRTSFRAYAFECVSPAEIVRRMLRHVDDEETMITVACVSIDPYSGEVAYSCAGHPPPLLIDDRSGSVSRLADASAPPLGVADAGSVREARTSVGDRVTIVLYTDGLIERRKENIDHGIDLLGRVVASGASASIQDTLGRVTAELGAPTDDVALLVARLTGEPMPFEVQIPSDPSSLTDLRRRLRAWLGRRGLEEEADDVLLAVSEACNNAIEHAYRDDHGSIRILVEVSSNVLTAKIGDDGRWRNPTVSSDRGRGFAIMHALMNFVDVRRTQDGTEVVLERHLQGHGDVTVAPIGV